jgi:AcrR family transcriptional regulator
VPSLTRKQQLERTRANLLDATMMCLVEHGYARTTTQRIQERAGISRGAMLHHFGSKTELIVAATHHIADIRLVRIRDIANHANGRPDALHRVVYAIRESMTGPPFQAAIELWTASRTDPELRAALLPAERKLGHALRDVFDQVSGLDDPHLARTRFEQLMALVRGLELTRLMRDDETIARTIIDRWIDDLRH